MSQDVIPAPSKDTETRLQLSNRVRDVMRRVPHPVAVITSCLVPYVDPSSEPAHAPPDLESRFRGMTVSSFNTVSLHPQPLVSLNVRLPSATYDAIIKSRTFLAHILSSSVAGARVADTFAKGNNGTPQAFETLVRDDQSRVTVLAGSQMQWAPLLSGEGVLRVLRCVTLPGKEILVGDHVVLIGEVAGVLEGKEAGGRPRIAAVKEDVSLVYADQMYCSTGEKIDPEIPLNSKIAAKPQGEDMRHSGPFVRTLGMTVRRGDEPGRI